MPYVTSLDSDVFVSYAHDDNEPLPGADGWVDTLVACLKKEVPRQLRIPKEDFELWFDKAEVAGNQPLTPQLLSAVAKSAVMVLVLSTGYLRSKWCELERGDFLRLVQAHQPSSIFVVHFDDIPAEKKPAELKDLFGYKFWKLDERKNPQTVGYPQPDREFYTAVLQLSSAIAVELKARRSPPSAQPPRLLPQQQPPVVVGSSDGNRVPPIVIRAHAGSVIYLAQTTDDLDHRRNGVRTYLEQLGVKVVPAQDYPPDPPAFEAAVRLDLKQSRLFVQLLSAVPGKRPPGLPQGYVTRQFELAQEAGVPILQWRSPDLLLNEVEDEKHREFLQGSKVHAEGIEDFKRELKRLLLDRRPVVTRPVNPFFFINFDAADRKLAQELSDIVKTCGGDFTFPTNGPDPGENRRGLQEHLTSCDAMIIVYGRTEWTWVKSQLLECQKSKANREKPLKSLAVLEGPPEPKNPLDIYVQPMVTLDSRARLDRPAIEAFVRSTMSTD
jgi:TIR domain-containing protein